MEADEATAEAVGTNPTGGNAPPVAAGGASPPVVDQHHHLKGEEEHPGSGGAAAAAAALQDHGGVGRSQQGEGKPPGVVPVSIITVDTSAPPLPSSLSKEDSLSSERGPHDHQHDDAIEEEDGDGGPQGRHSLAAGGGTPLKGTPLKGSHDPSGPHYSHHGQASHQARTPKHANRTEEGSKSWDDATVTHGRGGDTAASLQHHAHPQQLHHSSHPHHPSQQPPPYHHPGPPFHSNSFPPPPPQSSASSRSTSAFHHPHDRQGPPPPPPYQQPPQPQRTTVPMQVSPGSSGGRYYQYNHAGPPRYGHPPMPPYEPPHQSYHAGGYRPAPPPAYGGPYGGGGPVPYGHQPPYAEGGGGGGGFEGGGPTWGRPPSYPNSGPPHPPPPPHDYHGHGQGPLPPSSQHPPHHPHSHGGGPPPHHHSPQQPPILQSPSSSDNFSRAVSSSFDRSIKSHDHNNTNANTATKSHRDSGEAYHHRHASQHRGGGGGLVVDAPPPADANEATDPTADDASWGQLNQVASVDEDEMRKRLAKDRRERRHSRRHGGHRRADTPDGEEDGGDDVAVTRSASNSSSLTNSPTDGVLKPAARLRAHLQEPPSLPATTDDDHALPANNNANVRIHSSLDSLSSVASEQALMAAANKEPHHPPSSPGRHHQHHRRRSSHSAQPLSPQGSTASLDLLKCASGSTALLLPRHDDPDGPYHSVDKRGHPHEDDDEEEGDDEDRGDEDTKMDASELRKAPSAEDSLMHLGHNPHHRRRYPDSDPAGMLSGPPKKRNRADMDPQQRKDGLKKSSPLSIECSPPNSPTLGKRKTEHLHKAGRFLQPQQAPTSVDSYYDKPPQYTYSLESAPPLPRDPAATQRPESTSSTITPMNVDGEEIPIPPPPPQIHHHPEPRSHHHHGHAPHPSIGQFPSWEIHHQDSFGGNSAMGGGEGGGASGGGHGTLMNSFSFTQEYPGLSANASADHGGALERGSGGGGHGPPTHSHQHHHPALESRNQSFEGGHYHGGGFARSDSMMSYEHQGGPPPPPMYDRGGQGGYHGPFPPQAPSWGSASSYPHGGHYYAGGYPPPPMRNYSDDSGGGRASPPSHHGHRGGGGFQPPPDFRAPPSLVPKAGPSQSQQLILSSPYTATSKAGAYGWSKEEDMRLTDIMKKYKNPRDWEPIAKEHNCGRSAKECHERWIRYLKPGVRKGQWTDHEDAIVMEVVTTSTEQPFTRWSDLAQRLPGRVGKQIRDRWVNHLNPNINHLPFSREDDLLLWEGHKKLGKRWVEISTKYFETNRSENHIKNRWYSASFKKFIANEFGVDAYSGKKDASSPKKKQHHSNSGTKDKAPPLTPSSTSGSPTKRTPAPADVMQCEEV